MFGLFELHKEQGTYTSIINQVYEKCVQEKNLPSHKVTNHVKLIYKDFKATEISTKIAQLLSDDSIEAKVSVIYQSIENLHEACPKNLGDWYFTGNYPTPGGNKVVNKAFMNFYEGKSDRAY